MNIFELFFECIRTLTVNKMRSGLAILGIIIGIGSVIALISLGQGSQKAIEGQIQSLGSNILTVVPGGPNTSGVRSAGGSGTTLTMQDVQSIESAQSIKTISGISPEVANRKQVTAGRNNTNTQVIGVIAAYKDIRNISLSYGNFISERDVDTMNLVAVLGAQVASDLFADTKNPVGSSIRISGKRLRVIGVAAAKGSGGFNNPDDAIYIPLSTAQKQILGTSYLSSIAIQATSKEVMTDTQNAVGYLLLEKHRIKDVADADFSIFSQNDILTTASQVTSTFTTLLGGIAGISLLVGGIGIMNIMLVTVTERTREIGLRKALGATRRIIISQFLIEAVVLTIIGGILGMMLGISISYGLSRFMNIPFSLSLFSVFLAIGVSGGIGIIFGWYPARRASRLQPIEALRYE